MSDRSKIEWTDATWNPLRAVHPGTGADGTHCVKISPACANCYAAAMNKRFGTGLEYSATSSAQVRLDEGVLTKPLKWKRPRKIFVGSMTDLYLDAYEDEALDLVFAMMYEAHWHTFQVLTKRPERMQRHLSNSYRPLWIGTAAYRQAILRNPEQAELVTNVDVVDDVSAHWPLPNVWLGVTAEDQQRADERREPLRALGAAGWSTFVSNEPALGSIDWAGWEFLKLLITGGESGHAARPSHPAWIRAARDFAIGRGIAFHFKQWGEWLPFKSGEFSSIPHWLKDSTPVCLVKPDGRAIRPYCFNDGPGHEMARVGKKVAGRLLDGRTWDEFPATEVHA
jgi:protein gp37